MPGTNEFKAFATGGGANVLTPSAYAALTALLANGFSAGVAPSQQLNTVWRQSSFVAAAVAQLIADAGPNALDDGNLAAFVANLKGAIGVPTARIAAAGGTVDAITAVFAPVPTAFVNGLMYYVRAAGANTTTTPTFTPNSGTLAAKTIVKRNNQPLIAGDIAGAGHWLGLQYDSILDKFVLQNPASNVYIPGRQLFTASGSWTCPAGVVEAWISGVAPGGGGGSFTGNGAGGGGGSGQAVFKTKVTVTPGTTYTVTLGSVGAAASVGGSGGSGGTSTFGALVTLTGGAGGGVGAGASGLGGAPGGAGGGAGENATYLNTIGTTGGRGGSNMFGSGGRGSKDSSTGNTATAADSGTGYGSGGGGSVYIGTGGAGAGAPGMFFIEW